MCVCVCVCTRLLSKWVCVFDCCCVSSSSSSSPPSSSFYHRMGTQGGMSVEHIIWRIVILVLVWSTGFTFFVSAVMFSLYPVMTKLLLSSKIFEGYHFCQWERYPVTKTPSLLFKIFESWKSPSRGFIKGHWGWTPPRWCFRCPVTNKNTKSPLTLFKKITGKEGGSNLILCGSTPLLRNVTKYTTSYYRQLTHYLLIQASCHTHSSTNHPRNITYRPSSSPNKGQEDKSKRQTNLFLQCM